MRMDFWDGVGAVMDGARVAIGVFCLICGVLVVLLVIWALRRMVVKLREANGIAASWPRAEAVVTDVVSRPLLPGAEETTAAVATYTFSDSAGRTFAGHDEEVALHRPAVGMRFKVAYDPADPRESHPAGGIRDRIVWWLVLSLIVYGLLLGCAALFLWQGLSVLL